MKITLVTVGKIKEKFIRCHRRVRRSSLKPVL